MTGQADFAEQHDLLVADRERTCELIAALRQTFTSIVDGTQFTATDDEHDPEGATIAFERSQTGALLEASKTRLVEIDLALARIAGGTYGTCEHCSQPIAPGRLLARPATRRCISCAT